MLKEAIVRGTARQAPSYLPPVNVNLCYVKATQTPRLNGLNPKETTPGRT